MKVMRARIPGKVMLAGEYAVLNGGPCLALTVDRWLQVTVRSQEQAGFSVRTNLWPEVVELHTADPYAIQAEPLLQACDEAGRRLQLDRVRVDVHSDLTIAHGLGSSSAVRLATLMALQAFAEQTADLDTVSLARIAWNLQREQQLFASGYDVLVQSVGGLVHWEPDYTQWPGRFERLPLAPAHGWVHVFVGGQGAPTASFGGRVRRWLAAEGLEDDLGCRSHRLVEAFAQHFALGERSSLRELCTAVREHRQLFVAAPSYPHRLLELLSGLPGFDETWTFKTTGAGGEDAILLIGEAFGLGAAETALLTHGWRPLGARFGEQGACLEEIES